MSSQSFRTGIIDLREQSRSYVILARDGDVVASGIFAGDCPDAGDVEALRHFATSLAATHDAVVDELIFVTATLAGSSAHSRRIAFTPIAIFMVTEAAAAAGAIPADCLKFQLIDSDAGMWRLVERRDGEQLAISSAPLAGREAPPNDEIARLAAFGFASSFHIGDVPESSGTGRPVHLSRPSLLCGARAAVEHQSRLPGCHVSRDQADHRVLTLHARHAISYDIQHVTRPVFAMDEPALGAMAGGRPVLLIVDANVDHIYGDSLDTYAGAFLNRAGKLRLDATESHKNGISVARICRTATAMGFPRNGIFVAVGGGVTLDIVGLAASLYLRGVGYIRIPTSLVGLIDAGLGVKQAVNFLGRKNGLGAYYPPTGVINDPGFLGTLALDEVSCGLAEIVKMAMIKDACLFELLIRHGPALRQSRFSDPASVAEEVLLRSSLLMLEELQPNLHESDTRRIVDFGHSFSPAIEGLSGYTIPHGRAVSIDMVLSTAIGTVRGLCPEVVLRTLQSLLRSLDLPAAGPAYSVGDMAAALLTIRQRRGGNLNLVVPTAIGSSAFVQDVSHRELAGAMALVADTSSSGSWRRLGGAGI